MGLTSTRFVRLRKVFQRIQDAGFKLKTSRFVQPKVCYLGNIVSADGVEPDPAKIQAVIDYPVLTNVKELRQFLGLAFCPGLFQNSIGSVQTDADEC